jgi:kinesin family member 12
MMKRILIRYYCFFVQLQFVGAPDMRHQDHGLIFRSFIYLFQLLKQRQTQENTQFVLKASFLEIYNEKVI